MALIPRVLFAAALLLGGVEVALAHPRFLPALVVQVAVLVWWVRAPGLLPGLLAVAPVAAAAVWEGVASPVGVHHGKLLPAAACLAWSLGAWKSRLHAHEAACGIVAAVYGLAAGSKLAGSGLRWFDADNLGLLLIERATGPLAAVRVFIAAMPGLCVTLAVTALLAEAAGMLFLWPRFRVPVAAVLVLLHLGIAVGMGYVYVSWALVVIALAWPDG